MPGHRGHQFVVGVEHRDGAGRQLGDHFRLRSLRRGQGAEIAGVGETDLEHDGDVRACTMDTRLGDVTDVVRAHLDDQVPGARDRRPSMASGAPT